MDLKDKEHDLMAEAGMLERRNIVKDRKQFKGNPRNAIDLAVEAMLNRERDKKTRETDSKRDPEPTQP